MENTISTLKPGNYMRTESVRNFLRLSPVHLSKVDRLEFHEGDYGVYFSTADLKTVVSDEMFMEMECECVTHMIL